MKVSTEQITNTLNYNYVYLRGIGIQYLERLTGELWTDFNAHDPGITILEQLCYAITDLDHRIHYDIPDILSEGDTNSYHHLFEPDEILTSHSVTQVDLKKQLIDIKGVRNAWVEKYEYAEESDKEPLLYYHAENNEITLNRTEDAYVQTVQLEGLYNIYIEQESEPPTDLNHTILNILHATRNLAEDYHEPHFLSPQKISIETVIEIDTDKDALYLLEKIYQIIDDYFSPTVNFYSFEELLAQGKGVEEIFDGPRLQHGFIDTKELQSIKRKTEIRSSDLINQIMNIEGVSGVKTFFFRTNDKKDPWFKKIDENSIPRLDRSKSSIKLTKRNLEVQMDKTNHFSPQQQAIHAPFRPLSDLSTLPPQGSDRKIGDYYSIQHQFSDTYGVNSNGLPNNATPERKAQAKQLKAYLLFFDQLLANYFSQLAHVKDLFSFSDENSTQIYFSTLLNDAELGLDDTKQNTQSIWVNSAKQRQENLEVHSSENVNTPSRKNRFLNHLLARFAEQFTDYSLALYQHTEEVKKDSITRKSISIKQRFLQKYPFLSSARGVGYNYYQPYSNNNRSVLEQRIQLKLGLTQDDDHFFMVEHILLRPISADIIQSMPILGDVGNSDPYSFQLSFIFTITTTTKVDDNNINNRAYIEQLVRDETPAHLLIHFKWVEKENYSKLKKAYQSWLKEHFNLFSNQADKGEEG